MKITHAFLAVALTLGAGSAFAAQTTAPAAPPASAPSATSATPAQPASTHAVKKHKTKKHQRAANSTKPAAAPTAGAGSR